MSSAWPLVALGEMLELKVDAVPVDASATYQIAGVYSFGKGLLARGPLPGTETTYKVFHRLHKDDFVLSQLKAWEGALARVTDLFDGWFLSPQFPTFRVKPDRLDIAYLDWYCKQSKVWDQLRSSARGMGDRRDSVSPAKFMSATIPLPPLAEQQRIVARIEELAAKIEEAKGFRRQTVEEAKALINSTSRQLFCTSANHKTAPFATVCTDIIDCLHSNAIYADPGIPTLRSPDVGWGKLFPETALKTSEEEYLRRTRRGELLPDDIIIVREGGGTGKAGIVEEGQKMSLGQRVMQVRPDSRKILPQFLLYQWLSPIIQQDHIVPLSKGSASPHLNIGAIKKFPIVLPPLEEQRRVVTYLDNLQAKVDSLKRLQTETAAELDAMLPSILDKAFKGEL